MSASNLWLQCATKCLLERKETSNLLASLPTHHSAAILKVLFIIKPAFLTTSVMIERKGNLYSIQDYKFIGFNMAYIDDYVLTIPNNPREVDFHAAVKTFDELVPKSGLIHPHVKAILMSFGIHYLFTLIYADTEAAYQQFPCPTMNHIVRLLSDDEEDDNSLIDDLVPDIVSDLITDDLQFSTAHTIFKLSEGEFKVQLNTYYNMGRDHTEHLNEYGISTGPSLSQEELAILASPYNPIWQLPALTRTEIKGICSQLEMPQSSILGMDNKRQVVDKLVFRPFTLSAEESTKLWSLLLPLLVKHDLDEVKQWLIALSIDVDASIKQAKVDLFPLGIDGALPGIANLIAEHI